VAARVLADLSPLRRSRDLRLLVAGQSVSLIGSQITLVALPYQVFVLTGSSLMVGLISLVELGPLVVLSLVGGAYADAIDRRRVMLVTLMLLAVMSALLAINAFAGPALWPLFVVAAFAGGLSGVDATTRRALIPALVPISDLPATAALNSLLLRSAQVVGPALGGLVIATLGLGSAYLIDLATFAAALVAVALMQPHPPQGGGTPVSWAGFREGLTFLRRAPILQGIMLIDISAMVFGTPRALFPAIGTEVLGGGAGVVGLLYAAPAAGAFIGALTSGWVGRVRRQGWAVVIAAAGWGAAIAAVAFVGSLWPVLVLLAAAGFADIVSEVFRSTISQVVVPDSLRGRISALFIVQVTGAPRVGDVESGVVGAAIGTQPAVLVGGLACIAAVAIVSAWRPAVTRWRVDALGRPVTEG
jgi:MFS family permease